MTELELHYPTRPYFITQGFGECMPSVCSFYKQIGLDGHNGIDSMATETTIVRAAHDGIVTFTGEDGSGGLGVVVRTLESLPYRNGVAYFKTIYWHLKVGDIWAKAAQTVRAGEPLGIADNTGFSTGTHLHFGLKPLYPGEQDWEWWNAESANGYKGAIDPMPYFSGLFAEEAFRYDFIRQMQFGSEGPDVWALQVALQIRLDFPSSQEPTGFFGSITQDAVKSFQRRNGIATWGTPWTTGYGRVGPKTLAKLNTLFS